MAGSKRRPKPARRRPGEGTTRQRSNGSWEHRVPVGQDAAGHAILKSFYGRTKEEAMQKATVWIAEHPEGPPPASVRGPFNDLLAAYVENRIRPPAGRIGTYEDYLSKIRLHIAPAIGQAPLYEVKLPRINQWLRDLFAATGQGRTVEKCYQIVRAALQYGVDCEILASNPAGHATVPQYEKRQDIRLSRQQADAFVEAAYGRLDLRKSYITSDGKTKRRPAINGRLGLLYDLAVFVGLRRGELLALRYGDLKDGRLTISRQIDDEGREHQYTKTDASRRTVEIADFLDAWMTHRVAQQVEGHGEAWKPDGLVFPTTEGTPILPSNLTRHFKQILAAAGLPDMRFHDLRHTAASLMVDSGASLAAVAKALGHRSPRTAAQRYVHGDEEGASQAISQSRKRVRGAR